MRLVAVLCLFGLLALSPFSSAQVSQSTQQGMGALLRGLDRITGDVVDLEVKSGETVQFKRMSVSLSECRFPEDNKSADAFAHLTIVDTRENQIEFEGWMIASSPALSALEHPRYDIWVLRCMISEG